ncbi:MAG: hypothetical protein ACLFTK_07850 [Anaerolineales bacterium]
MRPNLAGAAGVVLFFGALAALDVNALLAHLTSHVPHGSTTDYYHFQWSYWWIRQALTEGLPVYTTQTILYPLGEIDLGLHTLAPFWFPAWAGLEPLVGPIAAMNLIIWLGVSLMGVLSYAWLRDYAVPRALAMTGAAFLMVLPWLGRAAELSHMNLLGFFFYPLTLLVWRRVVRSAAIGWAVVLGIIFWLMWLTDTMWLVFVPILLAPYGLLTLVTAPDNRARARLAGLGLLATGLFLALSWFIAPMQPVLGFERSTISSADLEAAERWSVSLGVYLLQPEVAEPGRSLGRALMLMLGLTLAATPWLREAARERWFWLAIGLFPLVLSVGPYIELDGTRVAAPYILLHEAFGGLFRTPERFMPAFVVCAVIFLALSWAPRVARWPRAARVWLAAGLLVIVIGDLRVFRPLESAPPAPDYDFYDMMREDGLDYVYVQIPVGMSSGWTEVGRSPHNQFRILDHEKRIVSGHVSRIADFAHYYYANEAVWGWFTGNHAYRDTIPDVLAGYVDDYPIGYLSVHQSQLEPAEGARYLGYLNGMDFLCPATVEGDAVLYRTRAHPGECPPRRYDPVTPDTWRVDFGLPGDEFFIGPGFYGAEIIGGPAARWLGAQALGYADIFFRLPDDGAYDLQLHALPPFDEPVSVAVFADDTPLGELEIRPGGYATYTLHIPAAARASDTRLRLAYDGAISPMQAGRSGDERPLAFALDWMRLERR